MDDTYERELDAFIKGLEFCLTDQQKAYLKVVLKTIDETEEFRMRAKLIARNSEIEKERKRK